MCSCLGESQQHDRRLFKKQHYFGGTKRLEEMNSCLKCQNTLHTSRPCREIFLQGICVSSMSVRSNSGLFVFPADASCLKHANTHKASSVSGYVTVLIQMKSFLWSYRSSAGFCVHSCFEVGVQFTKWKDHPKENWRFPPEPQSKVLLKWLELFHPALPICSFISRFTRNYPHTGNINNARQ